MSEDLGELVVIGGDIPAGASVCRGADGMLYSAGGVAGEFVGTAAENLREGFRALVRAGTVREDDA